MRSEMLAIVRRKWPKWSLLCCALPLAAAAAGTAPTPGQTLNDDVLGPRVDWYGVIERTVRDDGETCFVLQRLIAGTRFIACELGMFNPRRFAPGKIVNVIGNLGTARPRTIGREILDYPLVASPEIRLAPPPAPDNYYPDRVYPYPYRPPPGWAPGFGYGFYYFR
jgi:hypothetical protein